MSEIYFIGGSPCSGKSSIAEMLVQKYGFQYFKQDDFLDEYMKKGASDGYELFKKTLSMSTEEMWMRAPSEQCNEEVALYEIMLAYSMKSISELSQDKPIIAEGAGFLPQFAKQMNVDKAHYICIVPTKEFQVRTYSKREWIFHYLSDCTDKDKAFSNWMDRDGLLAEKVIQDAKDLEYRYLIVDGTKSIDENSALVEKVFCLSGK